MHRLSIIVPTLNEAASIDTALSALAPYRAAGHEVIVVDGGSVDGTPALAAAKADRVLSSAPGRGRQLAHGVRGATGDTLLLLHADTTLPFRADRLVQKALARGAAWGRFDVRLSGSAPALRVVERMMNWRSCLTGIATGDQAMFMTRQALVAAGGVPEIPLMEDIALSRRLKSVGRPACIRVPVVTSSRRWEHGGILRTVVLMWSLRAAYFLRADPVRLARIYHGGAR